MYPDIPEGYALVKQHMTSPGGDTHALNIYGVRVVESFADANLLATTALGVFAAEIMQGPCSDYNADSCSVVWNKGGTLYEGYASGDNPGQTDGTPVPVQVSVLVRKQTGLIGRHYRGRFYIPGLDQAVVDDTRASMTSGAYTNWSGYAASFLDQVQVNIGDMVLLHRDLAVPPTIVESLEVELLLATQRRRLRKAAHR